MAQSDQCIECTHYLGALTCKAFPDGIPLEITTGRHNHRKPFPGDNGIRYEISAEFRAAAANKKADSTAKLNPRAETD